MHEIAQALADNDNKNLFKWKCALCALCAVSVYKFEISCLFCILKHIGLFFNNKTSYPMVQIQIQNLLHSLDRSFCKLAHMNSSWHSIQRMILYSFLSEMVVNSIYGSHISYMYIASARARTLYYLFIYPNNNQIE